MLKSLRPSTSGREAFASQARVHSRASRRATVAVRAEKVTLQHAGGTTILDVPEGESILSVAIDQGLDVPHDCKLGVCMNCAARLVDGVVDQGAGMLSDEVKDKGYVLLCCALPQGEVTVQIIEEEELLAEVMD